MFCTCYKCPFFCLFADFDHRFGLGFKPLTQSFSMRKQLINSNGVSGNIGRQYKLVDAFLIFTIHIQQIKVWTYTRPKLPRIRRR